MIANKLARFAYGTGMVTAHVIALAVIGYVLASLTGGFA